MDWLEHLSQSLSPGDLSEARRREAESGKGEDFVLDSGLVKPDQVLIAKARFHRLPHLSLNGYHPEAESLSLVPEEQARKFLMLPLFRLDGKLHVAMIDPNNLDAQDFVRKRTGMRIESVLVQKRDLLMAIDRHYSGGGSSTSAPPRPAPAGDAAPAARSRPVPAGPRPGSSDLKEWEPIVSQAAALRASDIHLEAHGDQVSLRYRVDGQLEEHPAPSSSALATLKSQMEAACPDSVGTVVVAGISCRVSRMAGPAGDSCNLRLHGIKLGELTGLGMDPRMSNRYDGVLKRSGLVLLAGPAGGGTTTTLHATLARLAGPSRVVVSLESPVERIVPGVVQSEHYASAHQASLVHDADVLAWDDVHDEATARIALGAAQAGKLVLVGMSALAAGGGLGRWLDLGLSTAHMLRPLRAVLAQKLMRRLCSQCRVKVEPAPNELQALGVRGLPPGVALYGPRGCPECRNRGYRGRVGIFELLEITPELRAQAAGEFAVEQIVKSAEATGHMTLRHAAIGKLLSGHTSLEEVKACLEELS